MPSQIYEILSLMMRYWFAALGVLIVLRAFWWLWKDHRCLLYTSDAADE